MRRSFIPCSFFVLFSLLGITFNVFCQTKVITPIGQNILVYDNGSWEYAPVSFMEDSSGMIMTNLDPLVKPKQQKFYIDERHQKALDLMEDTILHREVKSYLSLIDNNKKHDLQQSYYQFAINSKNKAQVSVYADSIEHCKKYIQNNEKALRSLAALYTELRSLSDMDGKKLNQSIEKLSKKLGLDMTEFRTQVKTKKDQKINNNTSLNTIDYAPILNCQKDTLYSAFEKKLNSTMLTYWFSYTPKKMKPFFKSNNLITTSCAIAHKSGKDILRVRIVISSKDAAKNYGTIAAGSFIKVVFITGKAVHIKASQNVNGTLENYTGYVVYDVEYPLGNDVKGIFKKVPINTIGIMWTSGFEVYPIYEVDEIINHFKCFSNL